MALEVENVMNGSMHVEKALGRTSRFEPLHFTLSAVVGQFDCNGPPLGIVTETGWRATR